MSASPCPLPDGAPLPTRRVATGSRRARAKLADREVGFTRDTTCTSTPTIAGPLTDGRHGWAFGATLTDLTALGYVEEEFTLSGSARSYRLTRPMTPDGRWSIEVDGEAPFITRLLVEQVFDAFLPTVSIGRVSPFTNVLVDPTTLVDPTPEQIAAVYGPASFYREDLGTPILLVNSECETGVDAPVRQPDTDTFRLWESAVPHTPRPG